MSLTQVDDVLGQAKAVSVGHSVSASAALPSEAAEGRAQGVGSSAVEGVQGLRAPCGLGTGKRKDLVGISSPRRWAEF